MSEFSFGADPEFFLSNKKTGSFVSAYGLFPGTKDKPHKLDQGAVQVDGMALEFNIDATSDPAVFHDRVNYVLEQIFDMMKQVDKNLEAVFSPIAQFEPKYFEGLPDDCKILGCDPDYNSKGQGNPPPTELMNRPFRTAAGHIHIGWCKDNDPMDGSHFEDCRYISEYFGQVDGDFSTANRQRQLYYGKAGAFRPKSYGVELRCPSNGWILGKKNKSHVDNPFGLISYIKSRIEVL